MEDHISDLVGLDKFKRSAMARYFGRLTEAERIETMKLMLDLCKQFIGKIDDGMRGKPDFFYSMFCLALWKMNWVRHDLAKKNPELTPKQAKEMTERRLASVLAERKDRRKRGKQKILVEVRFYHVVRVLRDQGLSWRELSIYLHKYHHTNISHVHLRKLFIQITEERKKREDNEG